MPNFQAIKIFRGPTWPKYVGTITNLQIVLNTDKKSLLKSSYPKNTCQNFLIQKNPEITYFKPKKFLTSSLSLEIRSTPLGVQGLWQHPFQFPDSWAKTVNFLPTIECFHMMSWRPYWCPKTMKWWPCWCPKPVLWELNSFLMQTLSFVPINLHRCWPREWKHSIRLAQSSLKCKFPSEYTCKPLQK